MTFGVKFSFFLVLVVSIFQHIFADKLFEGSTSNQENNQQSAVSPQQQQQPGGQYHEDYLVSRPCLGCLCEAASGCNVTIGCGGGLCGALRITREYFIDSEINAEPQYANVLFESCAQNLECSAAIVRKYMAKFAPRVGDCSGDGIITCIDFALIHRFGPRSCRNHKVLSQFEFFQRYEPCADFADLD